MICETCRTTIFCGNHSQREHHSTRGSFEASIAANCYICRNVWDRLSDDYRHRLSLQSDSFGPTYCAFRNLSIEDPDSNDPITGTRITIHCNWINDGVPGLPPNVTFGLRPSPTRECNQNLVVRLLPNLLQNLPHILQSLVIPVIARHLDLSNLGLGVVCSIIVPASGILLLIISRPGLSR